VKVLLVAANQYAVPYPVYPLGLDYVRQALEPRHDVRILDLCAAGDEASERLADALDQFRPHVVGLALRNVDNIDAAAPVDFIDRYRRIAAEVRARSPALLVLGGSAFNIFPTEMMDATGADYGILGEGERLALLLHALENKTDPRRAAGVVTLGRPPVFPEPYEGRIVATFDPHDARVAYYLNHGGMLNLQTKRGCPFGCVYCTYPVIEGRRMRLFAPDDVGAQAKALQGAGAKYLFITDSSYNAAAGHSLAVAEAFQKNRIVIPWGAYFTPVPMPPDYYRRLRDSGLTHVEFGVDSLAATSLRQYQKPFSVADVVAAHRAAIDAELHVAHYFVLGGPGENRETLAESLDNAERLEKGVLFFFCGMRIYPNTPLHTLAVQEGQIAAADNCLRSTFYRPKEIDLDAIRDLVAERTQRRPYWVIGAGDEKMNRTVARLHAHGHAGPLWEKLLW
jgi:radical SAM superfamily enzyme YgiQ (UPF0313 family)